MAGTVWEEEWELCNDDGFVYKRKKRRQDSIAAAAPPVPASDPVVEKRQRRERKKRTLMKLRDQYQKEIDHWERLSNMLQEMEKSTHQQQTFVEFPLQSLQTSGSVCQPLIDDLLLQAEAQEAIIQNLANLCDVAEVMCKASDEGLKQSFFELPIWGTPCGLMASLSDE
ncbi:PREDICTED: uncharacterized protein LOC104593068 [Nelumbo nucifera]|uniref:Uncharacterized protein LOC104593068 n=2 Tax=Nelumbo nucifera TaxID=4432 RepID=A0A1U7ZS26_NELNU|nr:PREDICTED: uncharacterized protein LOC104593068 [Nelumbo nucifera]DAD34431.1 TPA_asm: hypothetical protein HUJ06_005071 [Nelumbo nucifera]